MPDLPELVSLLYRADWTQLSLSAAIRSRRDHTLDQELRRLVSDERRQAMGPLPGPWRPPEPLPVRADEPEPEHRILLAPGGRYRVEADDGRPVTVGDGESHWMILGGAAHRCPSGGPHRSGHGLFTPQWLIACYELDITGGAEIGSRSAYRVTATPRAVSFPSDLGHYHLLDRVEVLVDAGLGIVDGIFGPDALWEAVSKRGRAAGTAHRTARLQVSMPGRYRIDYLTGDWRAKGRAVACDGEHTRKLYANRVATGPARPLEQDFATMVDPAWLLNRWTLTAGGEVSVAGRPGWRIVAQADGGPLRLGPGQPFSPIESVVDAELGILLRLTCYFRGRPAARTELRSVTVPARAADFRIDPGPGMRAVTDPGGLLADLDLPTPVKGGGHRGRPRGHRRDRRRRGGHRMAAKAPRPARRS